ncbi:MAG: FKBP-type peptidyl-prolyl cis-trans isomerase [Bacteroidales bacterium]
MNLKNLLLFTILGVFVISCGQDLSKPKNVKLKSQLDSASYALGADVANHLKDRNNVDEVNLNAFIKGFTDEFDDKDKKLEEEEISSTIQSFLSEAREKTHEKNLEEGQKFLEENKEKDEVVETESGLQYEVIEEGSGSSPSEKDTVRVHYEGKHIDGGVFDSSVERDEPAEFPLDRVIPGWTEGLQLMKEGAKYKFYIPTDLAYGENVRPGSEIEPNEALIFEVELLEVIPAKEE